MTPSSARRLGVLVRTLRQKGHRRLLTCRYPTPSASFRVATIRSVSEVQQFSSTAVRSTTRPRARRYITFPTTSYSLREPTMLLTRSSLRGILRAGPISQRAFISARQGVFRTRSETCWMTTICARRITRARAAHTAMALPLLFARCAGPLLLAR